MRELVKTEAYVIAITQLEEFPYSDKVDMILRVGNDHHSLIGKFSITYIFEVLEALYHLKYGMKSNEKKQRLLRSIVAFLQLRQQNSPDLDITLYMGMKKDRLIH